MGKLNIDQWETFGGEFDTEEDVIEYILDRMNTSDFEDSYIDVVGHGDPNECFKISSEDKREFLCDFVYSILFELEKYRAIGTKQYKKMLIYKGIKVKLKNENNIHGSLLDFYQEHGYVYVNRIFENGNVFLSNSPHGCLNISASSDVLIPIYDENILTVLNNKKEEFYNLDKEIKEIEKFINERCKD